MGQVEQPSQPPVEPLQRAFEVTADAADVGFDWPSAEPVFAKILEELDEVREAVRTGTGIAEEIGDLLFSVVNLARHLRVDPTRALDGTTHRFERRFSWIVDQLEARGMSTRDVSLEVLDGLWDEAKRLEPSR